MLRGLHLVVSVASLVTAGLMTPLVKACPRFVQGLAFVRSAGPTYVEGCLGLEGTVLRILHDLEGALVVFRKVVNQIEIDGHRMVGSRNPTGRCTFRNCCSRFESLRFHLTEKEIENLFGEKLITS